LNANIQSFNGQLAKINTVGFNKTNYNVEFKSMLYRTYARCHLTKGLDVFTLNQNQINELQTIESNAIKIAYDLSTRFKSTPILNAHKLNKIEQQIKKEKLAFFVRMANNTYTKQILENIRIESNNNFVNDSIINDVIDFTKCNSNQQRLSHKIRPRNCISKNVNEHSKN